MNEKKAKEIRRTVKQLAGERISELAYVKTNKKTVIGSNKRLIETGTLTVAPNTKRGIEKSMKKLVKGKR